MWRLSSATAPAGKRASAATPAPALPARAYENRLLWATADPDNDRDVGGVLECDCQDYTSALYARRTGVSQAQPVCGHIVQMVSNKRDEGVLLRACSVVDMIANPLLLRCYWGWLSGGSRKRHKFLVADAYLSKPDEPFPPAQGLVEVYGVGRFLGYMRAETLCRFEVGLMLAAEYQAYAMETPCLGCGAVYEWSDDKATRWMLLDQGIQLAHHDNICAVCDQTDLIPKV